MKKTLVFAALIAAVVALSQTYGERGTTFVMLLLVGALYIFAEMNSSVRRAARNYPAANLQVVEFRNTEDPAA